jgi:site-specific DNA-adenine methylase
VLKDDGDYGLVVPVAYQGGKSRLAGEIVDHWWPTDSRFYDLCCGSGAITIEMLNRGASIDDVVMVDAGPWGLFWRAIGDGTFDFDAFCAYLAEVPQDRALVRGFMEELSRRPADQDTAEVFIILQAAAFGGKALWMRDNHWRNNTFRSYWEPTATSSRRSPVNPMMPMPDTLRRRVWTCMERMWQVTALCADAAEVDIEPGSLAYMDPPYLGTTAYGHTLDAEKLFRRIGVHSRCYISEGRRVGDEGILLHLGRAKGGISGDRKVTANQEWLSWTA